jgi:hypothetical protein
LHDGRHPRDDDEHRTGATASIVTARHEQSRAHGAPPQYRTSHRWERSWQTIPRLECSVLVGTTPLSVVTLQGRTQAPD